MTSLSGRSNSTRSASGRSVRPTIDEAECRRGSSVIEYIGRKWTSGIMLALGHGATRFSEIQLIVAGISPRMLSVRLRELEQHRLVNRVVTPSTPVSVTYHLTERGQELLSAVHHLAAYGAKWEKHL